MTTTPPISPWLARLTRTGFWAAVLGGLLLPWGIMLGVDYLVRGVPWLQSWYTFTLHLFAPGYNLFLVGLLTAVPFIALALTILLHLGKAPIVPAHIPRQRAYGIACASVVMVALATWTHIEVLVHPDAQGALAYFFLPVWLLCALPVGYALGRLAARWLVPGSAE